MEWRLLDTGVNNAFYNMAVDEAVMKAHREGLVPPTIRFYQWSPPGLSLGYFQKAGKEIDDNACKRHNIDIVRRLTGGRAILHDDELTYSIVISEESNYLPLSVIKSYKIISEGIMIGLNRLGIKAEMKAVDENKKAPKGISAACFDAPSWYEIVVDKKKLVGSAQTRQQGIILQHGSILFTIDVDRLYELLKMPDNRVRERMKQYFLEKATALNLVSTEDIDINKLKNELIKGWEATFNIKLLPAELIDREIEWIIELEKEKYQSYDWNFKR
jgi:lipoyl(octanoyl) transferase